LSSEPRPGEGIFHFWNRRQRELLLDAFRPTASEVITKAIQQWHHDLWWAPGDSVADVPEHKRQSGELMPERAKHETSHTRNGLEGAFHGYKGGRPRKWSDDPRWQKRMEDEIALRIDEGLSDREIADAVFGDSSLYKRVQRFRHSRTPGS
jgi:hypothetical protein